MVIQSNRAELDQNGEDLLRENNELRHVSIEFRDALKTNNADKIHEVARMLNIPTQEDHKKENLKKLTEEIDIILAERRDALEIKVFLWVTDLKREKMLEDIEDEVKQEKKRYVEKQEEFFRLFYEMKLKELSEYERTRVLAQIHAKLAEELDKLNKKLEELSKERDHILAGIVELKKVLQELKKKLKICTNKLVSAMEKVGEKMLSGKLFPDDSPVDGVRFHENFKVFIAEVKAGRVKADGFDAGLTYAFKGAGKGGQELSERQTEQQKVYIYNVDDTIMSLLAEKRLIEEERDKKEQELSEQEKALEAVEKQMGHIASQADGLQTVKANLEAGKYTPNVDPDLMLKASKEMADGRLQLTPEELQFKKIIDDQFNADNYDQPGLAAFSESKDAQVQMVDSTVEEPDKNVNLHVGKVGFFEARSEIKEDKEHLVGFPKKEGGESTPKYQAQHDIDSRAPPGQAVVDKEPAVDPPTKESDKRTSQDERAVDSQPGNETVADKEQVVDDSEKDSKESENLYEREDDDEKNKPPSSGMSPG